MKHLIFISLLLTTFFIKAQEIDGTYQTDFNEMTLFRNGDKVTGTYKHKDGKIEGTIKGKTLTGWWYQSNGKGKFIFEFNNDFTAFTGKWGYNDAQPGSAWNGQKKSFPTIKNETDISGTYQTDFNEMRLIQNGNKVTGTYKHRDGKITGTLENQTLTGWWYQSNGKGRFKFVFNDNFNQFTGKWGYNDAEPSSAWNGKKTGN